jgi:hypothetical protein
MFTSMSTTLLKGKPEVQAGESVDWSLLSPYGRVLFYIAFCPGCSVREIAGALGLTERTVWSLVTKLRRSGMVHMRRNGRTHTYRINLDAPLFHPALKGFTLRDVMGQLVEKNGGRRDSECPEPVETAG